MNVAITVTGDDLVENHVRDIGRRARDARPATKAARKVLQEGVKVQFETQGDHFGTPWPALSDATILRKGSSTPLEESGDMKASLTGGRGKRSSATKKKALVGTSIFYARFAQAGTSKGEPARPVVGASTVERQAIVHIVDQWLIHGRVATSVSIR